MQSNRIDIIGFRDFHTSPLSFAVRWEHEEWTGTGEGLFGSVTRLNGESDDDFMARARAEADRVALDQ